jgi:hypothetical protein
MDATSYEELEFTIANLTLFFKGSFSWVDLMTMPLPILGRWIAYANRINQEQKDEIQRESKRTR